MTAARPAPPDAPVVKPKAPGRRLGIGLLSAISLALVLAALAALSLCVRPFTVAPLTFKTNVVADTTNDQPLDISAALYLPRGAAFPVPLVIIVPSSGGVEEEREIYYAQQLARAGMAALVVDSFAARHVQHTLYDQSQLDSWDVENDAIAALRLLAADSRFRADRVAILGVSKGGTAAMNLALRIRRDWMGVHGVDFAAHIALSPDCGWVNRSVVTTGAPILFLLAGSDDQTPPELCLERARRMSEAGNSRIETRVYAGAQHAWEELGPRPEYDPDVENYAQCKVWIEDDGQMFTADTGELVPESDWHAWAAKRCMRLGAHCCGGTAVLKAAATGDIIAFLRKYGF